MKREKGQTVHILSIANARDHESILRQEVDAAYLRLVTDHPMGMIEVAEGINVDVTESMGIAGIEILDVKRRFPLQSLFVYEYGTDPSPSSAAS